MARMEFSELNHTDELFLNELSDEMGRLTDRHNASPRVFVPAEIEDELEQAIADKIYNPDEEPIPEDVMNALIVNLLTEDGLPYYTSALENKAPSEHPFTAWVHQWTAEEGRHSPTIYAFMRRSGQFDMRQLEFARMATMTEPDTPRPASLIEGIVYPAIQEPATEISHRNTITRLPDTHRKIGRKAISPVVGDEVKHGNFYVDLSVAALEIDPSTTVIAIAKQIGSFAMPGKAIPGFDKMKKQIEAADIFGVKQLAEIYNKLFKESWKIESIGKLSAEAEVAVKFIAKKRDQMNKLLERRAEATTEL